MDTYKIVRKYADRNKKDKVVARGLTLEEATRHCDDPETSSSTCTNRGGRDRTKKHGPWFECYYKE